MNDSEADNVAVLSGALREEFETADAEVCQMAGDEPGWGAGDKVHSRRMLGGCGVRVKTIVDRAR
jgi:hypothetical protein